MDGVVVGLKRAHTQVRFIEETAPSGEYNINADNKIDNLDAEVPAGKHNIIADDNIDNFVAEVPTKKLMTFGKQGAGYWT